MIDFADHRPRILILREKRVDGKLGRYRGCLACREVVSGAFPICVKHGGERHVTTPRFLSWGRGKRKDMVIAESIARSRSRYPQVNISWGRWKYISGLISRTRTS